MGAMQVFMRQLSLLGHPFIAFRVLSEVPSNAPSNALTSSFFVQSLSNLSRASESGREFGWPRYTTNRDSPPCPTARDLVLLLLRPAQVYSTCLPRSGRVKRNCQFLTRVPKLAPWGAQTISPRPPFLSARLQDACTHVYC